MNKISIYVHIPFCSSKCYYCSFVSGIYEKNIKQEYFDNLYKEILSYKNKLKNHQVSTIYIGGGTPSSVDEKYIIKLLEILKNNFKVCENAEISIECNPSSTTKEKLEKYKISGVNRISFGVQTLCQKSLDLIGRKETKNQVFFALKNAKKVGFDNINCDVMLGLPNQTKFSVYSDVKKLIKYKIKHISAYMLMLEENTKLFSLVEDKKIKIASDEKSVKIYEYIKNKIKRFGFDRYEVSNFAKSGYECAHNKVYWQMKDYIGFGVSAHSFFLGNRFENTSSVSDYLTGITKVKEENISLTEQKEEYVMLALRCKEGIYLEDYKQKFGDLLEVKKQEIKFLLDNELIEIKNEHLFVKDNKFGVLNSIVLKLI